MKTTRCKFRCNSVTSTAETKDFEFSAVTGPSDENKTFWKWTPTGALKFSCVNPHVEFVPGQEYYLDISVATPEA